MASLEGHLASLGLTEVSILPGHLGGLRDTLVGDWQRDCCLTLLCAAAHLAGVGGLVGLPLFELLVAAPGVEGG